MGQKNFDVSAEQELTLPEVFRILRAKLVWILICGAVVAAVMGMFTACFVAPTYSAYTTMYVYTTQKSQAEGSISNSDLAAAESLAATYQEILQSNTVLSAVCSYVAENWEGDRLDADDLEDMIRVSTISDTQMLKIEVTAKDPKQAEVIANAFAAVGPTEIVRVTKAGGVEIVDYAQLPTHADGPHVLKNIVLGMAAGLMAAAVYFLLRGIYDTTIYTENDLDGLTNLPILGSVPEISQAGNTKKSIWVIEEGGDGSNE